MNGEKNNANAKEERNYFSFGRLFFGLIILLAGIYYLGKSLGFLPANLEINIWQLWPLLIIAAGLSLISGRSRVSFAIGILVFLAVASILVMIFSGGWSSYRTDYTVTPIEITKNSGIDSAVFRVKAGAVNLDIKGGAEKLAEGKTESGFMDWSVNSTVNNRVQEIDIAPKNSTGRFYVGGKNNFLLAVNSQTPADFFLDIGVSKAIVDLREVMATTVNIQGGVSDIEVFLGDKVEKAVVRIDTGVSSLKVHLSRSVGARMTLDSGAASQNIIGLDKIGDNIYQTSDYDSGSKKIDLNLKIGLSDLRVDRQ